MAADGIDYQTMTDATRFYPFDHDKPLQNVSFRDCAVTHEVEPVSLNPAFCAVQYGTPPEFPCSLDPEPPVNVFERSGAADGLMPHIATRTVMGSLTAITTLCNEGEYCSHVDSQYMCDWQESHCEHSGLKFV